MYCTCKTVTAASDHSSAYSRNLDLNIVIVLHVIHLDMLMCYQSRYACLLHIEQFLLLCICRYAGMSRLLIIRQEPQ